MAQKRNSKNQAARREVKATGESTNGKKMEGGGGGGGGAGGGGGPKYSLFTWFVVLSLVGVWSSVAVVYFDIVDYDDVIGKLTAYDADGDGDFDVEDAKILLGLKDGPGEEREAPIDGTATNEHASEAETANRQSSEPEGEGLAEETVTEIVMMADNNEDHDTAVPLSQLAEEDFVADDPGGDGELPDEEDSVRIDTTGVLMSEEAVSEETVESGQQQTSSKRTQQEEMDSPESPEVEPSVEPEPQTGSAGSETTLGSEGTAESQAEDKLKEKAKKKKPKLFNKLDKSIKSEIDAAEKLRKKGKVDEALKAFESLVQQYPQSPRALYGRAQAEDDQAEKSRSNELLQKAINTYREAAELPDATPDLIRTTLKRRADRQQFLGKMRGSLTTLERLVQMFPEDVGLKNDLGVAHLLMGDNKGAKRVYEEILVVAPGDGFAKVHYGFILKSENKIAESIPYLKEGLESGEPGTDDGRFYFHLGDALQRMGDSSAYHWYELGHQRGHFASVWQRSLYNVDGLKAQPWWTAQETGYTDLVKTLERNWRSIREEALSVIDQNTGLFVPEEENLRERGDWGQFTLWQQGKKAAEACRSVPKTCSLLDRYPEAIGCKRGQIKFSVMQPGTHVWPHTGPTNCRLRLHLGLVVPREGCRIRCTNQTREWEEGKVLIFDDSFEHEVWQDATSYRLIFIIDVWHPELTQYQRQTLSPI